MADRGRYRQKKYAEPASLNEQAESKKPFLSLERPGEFFRNLKLFLLAFYLGKIARLPQNFLEMTFYLFSPAQNQTCAINQLDRIRQFTVS